MDVQNLDPRSIKTFEPLSCSSQGGRGGFPDLGQGGKAVGEAETKLHVGPFVAERGSGPRACWILWGTSVQSAFI